MAVTWTSCGSRGLRASGEADCATFAMMSSEIARTCAWERVQLGLKESGINFHEVRCSVSGGFKNVGDKIGGSWEANCATFVMMSSEIARTCAREKVQQGLEESPFKVQC